MNKILIILILIVVYCINLTADLNEGLIGHYPFNGNENDESGNENHGTANGEILLTADRFGNDNSAYYFDGVDDFIDIGQTSNFHSNSMTGTAWIKLSQLLQDGYMKIMVECDGSTNYSNELVPSIHFSSGTSRLQVAWGNGSGTQINSYSSVLPITPNTWFHIAYSRSADLTNIKFYLNGTEYSNLGNNGGSIPSVPQLVSIGRLGELNFGFFNGTIDDIRVYNRVLTESEIQELYEEEPLSSNFVILPENAYIGEQIQFTDTSTGNPITWEWDFENDGILDSFIQNPTHTYNSEGLYSVKLKISNGTLIDSLTKEITVEYCPPAFPQNVNVEISEDDAVISWAEVDTTICGSSIVPDLYLILYNEYPDGNSTEFYYHGYTTETTYTHFGVIFYGNQGEPIDQMFYQIIAVKNYNREQIEYLESLNTSRAILKWSEVKWQLDKMK